MVSHVFEPVGCDGAIVQFWTPSWSRPTHEGHELTLSIDKRTLHCSCEDSVCRGKNYLKVTALGHCKHCQAWIEHVWPILARALKEAV